MAFTVNELLLQAKDIRETETQQPIPGLVIPPYIRGSKFNKWRADMKVMMASIPDWCPLKDEFVNARIWKQELASALDEMIGLLSSYLEWQGSGQATPRISGKQYDLFLSHANKDKIAYVDALYASLSKLGIPIFYDKEVLQWGDKWKERILEGVAKSEFAIIVVSDNFFGREWTEKELSEFLHRQDNEGQKLILPLLYNISSETMAEHYPTLSDIQYIESTKYNSDEIALLFARQLIQRLKRG